ncbi:MAG: GNAT family N-acetyltransferase [Planctomycetota bacterium]|nr:GNAT family N-acetyltransferase [Planctomycetota bacterium]MDP6763954.1 GNAT family N-acetyltransferase [Planctomycetota bacterium]MDP6990961.1 GNAT family N-acetyltransferase [Planctomycetota bacterium]
MSAGDGKAARPHVRASEPGDEGRAEEAARLIDSVAEAFDIARRDPEFLRAKIHARQAALAEFEEDLVGFGYWSAWDEGRFVSHSGLVVRPDLRGRGLGGELKRCLFASSRERLPAASVMSLTTSPQVRAMNLSLGFRVVPLDALPDDPEFWKGCEACRNVERVRREGLRCCCEAMLLDPADMEGEA